MHFASCERGLALAEEARAFDWLKKLVLGLGEALERWEWARSLDSAGLNALDAAR